MKLKYIFGQIVNYFLAVLPKQKKIVFVNFLGRGYGDSPKYIAEEIMRQSLPYDLVWLVYDMNDIFPNGIRKVKFYSLKSRYELSTARVIISNTKSRLPYSKKRTQYYIQTWHGGFGVKYIEKDIEQFLPDDYVRDSKYDSSITDLILSGSDFQTQVIKDSFWYDGEIFMKGIPRNDIFFNYTQETISKLKKSYGFEEDVKIVIYAPTFRKNGNVDVYQLNAHKLLQTLRKKTGDVWKLIIRLHPSVAGKSGIFHYDDDVIDGSSYADSQELLVLSDLLITDFSSMMMDFAIMRKPVFLFILDLQDYIKDAGGVRPIFYNLPFSMAHSNEELNETIREFDMNDYHNLLDGFMHKYFRSYDDGHASEYVVERIKKIMGLE